MPPPNPKIYHITHVDNLASIVRDGALFSDAEMIARGGPDATIGMSAIKERRLTLPVECHAGTCVGEYVPFYFCPRSVMLYLIYRGNSPELAYRGGQGPIVHLEADLQEVISWADEARQQWAFSLSNAGARYAQFRRRADQLDQINWTAVGANTWHPAEIKEGKQAEFLVYGSFPWTLVTRIGVASLSIRNRVTAEIAGPQHQPRIAVEPGWYY